MITSSHWLYKTWTLLVLRNSAVEVKLLMLVASNFILLQNILKVKKQTYFPFYKVMVLLSCFGGMLSRAVVSFDGI